MELHPWCWEITLVANPSEANPCRDDEISPPGGTLSIPRDPDQSEREEREAADDPGEEPRPGGGVRVGPGPDRLSGVVADQDSLRGGHEGLPRDLHPQRQDLPAMPARHVVLQRQMHLLRIGLRHAARPSPL